MAIPSELAYLAHTQPPEARRRLLSALETHGGNLTHTARSLGLHYRSVLRLCQRLGLQETAATLRAQFSEHEARVLAGLGCSGMTRMSHHETTGKEPEAAP